MHKPESRLSLFSLLYYQIHLPVKLNQKLPTLFYKLMIHFLNKKSVFLLPIFNSHSTAIMEVSEGHKTVKKWVFPVLLVLDFQHHIKTRRISWRVIKKYSIYLNKNVIEREWSQIIFTQPSLSLSFIYLLIFLSTEEQHFPRKGNIREIWTPNFHSHMNKQCQRLRDSQECVISFLFYLLIYFGSCAQFFISWGKFLVGQKELTEGK